MNLDLKGQVVLVAGSSRGIGRSIAAALLEEGASIVLTGRDETALHAAQELLVTPSTYNRILPIKADFTQPGAAVETVRHIVEHFGRLDHLIANAGFGSGKRGWDLGDDDWNRMFEGNFFCSVRLAQAALPYLTKNAEGGSILFISSIVAIEATPAPLPYSAAKAALNNYSKNLAYQLGPQKVRVNTLAPGNIFFEGGTWDKLLASKRDAVETMLLAEVPLRRFGTPEEIAAMAAFLCSSRAAFATGGCYVVDGGQTRSL